MTAMAMAASWGCGIGGHRRALVSEWQRQPRPHHQPCDDRCRAHRRRLGRTAPEVPLGGPGALQRPSAGCLRRSCTQLGSLERAAVAVVAEQRGSGGGGGSKRKSSGFRRKRQGEQASKQRAGSPSNRSGAAKAADKSQGGAEKGGKARGKQDAVLRDAVRRRAKAKAAAAAVAGSAGARGRAVSSTVERELQGLEPGVAQPPPPEIRYSRKAYIRDKPRVEERLAYRAAGEGGALPSPPGPSQL